MSTERVLDNHARAERLRRAAAEVLAPDMEPGRDREVVLSLVGLAAHRLESDHEIRRCLRCGREFSFDPRNYASRGQQLRSIASAADVTDRKNESVRLRRDSFNAFCGATRAPVDVESAVVGGNRSRN